MGRIPRFSAREGWNHLLMVSVVDVGGAGGKLLRGCPIDRAANLLWNGQPAKHETDKAELNVADT